jgi:SM-20-related protein
VKTDHRVEAHSGFSRHPMSATLEPMIDELVEQGWSVRRDAFPETLVEELKEEARTLWQQGVFRQAGIGREGHVHQTIRGDVIYWWNPETLSTTQQRYWEAMEALRCCLNEALFINVSHFETHYAVYPPGTRYEKHVDCLHASTHRVISAVLYLNESWKEDDGGCLRMYLNDECTRWYDVQPSLGTFVLFRSDTIEHEVLPARRVRFSLTGWFRRRR